MTETTFTITDTFGQTRLTSTLEISGVEVINPDGETPLGQLGVRIRHVDTKMEWLGPEPPPPLDK